MEGLYRITGRGPLAAIKEVYWRDIKGCCRPDYSCILLKSRQAPIAFTSRGMEMAHRMIGGILLPLDLEVEKGDYIVVLED